jgi:hypothetical protein
VSRPGATVATVVLALLACFGLLVLWFATGQGYLDDPPTASSTIHDAWLWGPAAGAAIGVVLAIVGIGRERPAVWGVGELLLAAPAIVAGVAL